MDVKKIIITAVKCKELFKVGVFAYKVYRLVPKFEKIEGVNTEKLIESVNSRYSESD